MIIDGHVHIGDKTSLAMRMAPFTAEQLIKHMDGPFIINGQSRRVDMALAQNHPTEVIYERDLREHHRYVSQCVKKYPNRLMGCMTINPHLNVDESLKELRRLVAEGGFHAIKLHPTMNAYVLNKFLDRLSPILEEAGKLNLPVIIHTGDPPFAYPVFVAPLAEGFPKTKIIIAHLGTQQVSYAHEAIYVARNNPNTYLEVGWGILPRLKDVVTTLGAERLVFATDCPIFEMGSQLRLVEVLGWDPPFGLNLSAQDVENVMGDNLARLLGLK